MSQKGMLPQVLGPRWNRSWLTLLSLPWILLCIIIRMIGSNVSHGVDFHLEVKNRISNRYRTASKAAEDGQYPKIYYVG